MSWPKALRANGINAGRAGLVAAGNPRSWRRHGASGDLEAVGDGVAE
jgi:hypothetical protein